MAKNEARPYKNSVTNRNKKNNSNQKSNKTTSINKSTKKKDNLNVTTRIRTDEIRINDSDSLDTSFLEGRIGQKAKNNKKIKEDILKENRFSLSNIIFLKRIWFLLSFLCIVCVIALFSYDKMFSRTKTNTKPVNTIKVKEVKKKKTIEKRVKIIDDNYLFVGDFHTTLYDMDQYDYHYVKEGSDDLSTIDLYSSINDKIYIYNPSVVFIEVGFIDLNKGVSEDEIISNIRNIVKGIKDNRPYCDIYIESIYPINRDTDNFDSDKIVLDSIDNDSIMSLNSSIKSLCKSLGVNYLDLYNILVEDGNLNTNYTDDGVKLNKKGYKIVKEKLNSIIMG